MHKNLLCLMAALLVGAAALAQPGAGANQNLSDDVIAEVSERGRELSGLFMSGRIKALVEEFEPATAEAVGGAEALSALHQQIVTQLGEERTVLSETILQPPELPGVSVYRRTARHSSFGGAVISEWAIDRSGAVVGFYITTGEADAEAESSYLDYSTVAALRLPFDGEWTVVWGGRSVEENYHAAYRDQRFAYDFLVLENGSSFSGDGKANNDYHCFGLPILAPAAGTVVGAESSMPDNLPGAFDAANPLGNHVIIDHGANEYSFLAHLRQGSVSVGVGDEVAAGDPIGECGNSGRSSEPHLHYHLQDSPEPGTGAGLPAQFNDYLADGEPIARGEPVQGQTISPR